jgi:hypothetical protein
LSETTIYENKEAALYIMNAQDVRYLNLKDESSGRIGELIRGFVGGPWGTLEKQDIHASASKRKSPEKKKCTIF